MTTGRDYYAQRHGQVSWPSEIAALKRVIRAVIGDLTDEGIFQIHFGYMCEDAGFVPGQLGGDAGAQAHFLTGVDFWPILQHIDDLQEFELFTALEFLHDHSAKPTKSWYHSWLDCGIHVTEGDDDLGRAEVRSRLNPLLARYGDGYELSEDGEVLRVAPFEQNIEPETLGDDAVDTRVKAAISTFRRYKSDGTTQRQAVRDLADVLELLRESGGTGLPRNEESRLFEIANSYGIRHWNSRQQTDYDQAIWLEWFFFTFLNAIDLAIKLRKRNTE